MKDPTKSPVWNESSSAMKLIIRATKSDSGLLFLEQNGSVACMFETDDHKNTQQVLVSLRLFHERLADLIDKIDSEEIDTDGDKKVFIQDDTGAFREQPPMED